MKSLPLVKKFTGDGYGATNPVILTQLKRTDRAAIYARSREQDPRIVGYEVLKIKVVPAGAPLPNGETVAETYESYPGAKQFGFSAWFTPSLRRAERKFTQLNAAANVQESDDATPIPKPVGPIQWPGNLFTVKELADLNSIAYHDAAQHLAVAVLAGTVAKTGKTRVVGRGKPPALYEVKGNKK